MKRIAAALMAALVLLLAAGAAAHPGKTDSKGGHYDHSTGEYHYHHGFPAHTHGPNGECPYNNEDKTGQNSGTSGGGVSTTKRSLPAPTSTPKPNNEPTPWWAYVIYVVIGWTFLGVPLTGLVALAVEGVKKLFIRRR